MVVKVSKDFFSETTKGKQSPKLEGTPIQRCHTGFDCFFFLFCFFFCCFFFDLGEIVLGFFNTRVYDRRKRFKRLAFFFETAKGIRSSNPENTHGYGLFVQMLYTDSEHFSFNTIVIFG